MVVEILVDTQDLGNKQNLIVLDEQGRHWNVEEALSSSAEFEEEGASRSKTEVLLERWIVQLGEPTREVPTEITPLLPKTYKNSIVLFRSLYTCARLLPAWKFGKKLFSPRSEPSIPQLRFRILTAQDMASRKGADSLNLPLYAGHDNALENFAFDPIDTPAGPISIRTTYRANYDLRTEDSEEVLSSRFIGMHGQAFEPSLARRQERTAPHRTVTAEVGSLPSRSRMSEDRPDLGQAYGSLSTFHQIGAQLGSSPISALRAAQVAGSESPEDFSTRKVPPSLRSAQGSRSSARSTEGALGVGRRPSVSFMPFKSPALSSSPSPNDPAFNPSQRNSLGKNSPLAALAEARNPTSARPTSRGSVSTAENIAAAAASDSSRPQPASRFSSSFGHRKSKLSTGGGSRTEDDTSSGKASAISSNAQPGSGVLAEGNTSSGSLQADDDNISDFLKLLDQKKDLRSFRSPIDDAGGGEASNRRTNAALNRYQRMRESNIALSESMSSSLMFHRSSASSSQRVGSVPAMVTGTSMSVSTSPGKPISPHTPHTPAIPSRLSANSIIEYPGEPQTLQNAGVHPPEPTTNPPSDLNTGPIDIPNSPRPYRSSCRRSSSVAQRRNRAISTDDDDIFPFATRSASLGVNDDRPPPDLGALASYPSVPTQRDDSGSKDRRDVVYGPMYEAADSGSVSEQQAPVTGREEVSARRSRAGPYRPRIGRGGGRGDTPPQDSSSSLVERSSASGSSDQRGGRYSIPRPSSTFEEDEPLFFAMSDIAAVTQSHRNLDDSRGGGDSGSSSRRGSRRGGY